MTTFSLNPSTIDEVLGDIFDTRTLIELIDTLESDADDESATDEERADARAELERVRPFASDLEDYAEDYLYGETVIRDDYFQTYAQELADEVGAVPNDVTWPLTCIDWEQATRELQTDYTAIEFEGVTYWIR